MADGTQPSPFRQIPTYQGQTQVLLLVSDVPNSYLRNTSFWLHLRIFGVSLREDLYWVQDSERRMNQTWCIVTQLFSIVRKNVKFEGSSEFDSRLRLTLISHLYVFSLPAHCSTTANAWSTKLNLDRTWPSSFRWIPTVLSYLSDSLQLLQDNHDNYGFDLRTSIALPPNCEGHIALTDTEIQILRMNWSRRLGNSRSWLQYTGELQGKEKSLVGPFRWIMVARRQNQGRDSLDAAVPAAPNLSGEPTLLSPAQPWELSMLGQLAGYKY
ncbi:hypothetical protein B0H14DRAFT_2588741 [Mycena olivaceomarginata]|nr:hypothetical protein B0H14DRAFT_2588741 [Mycena olivaceomarginata]